MKDLAIAYVAALVVFGVLDFVWLKNTAGPLYQRELSAVMSENVNMKAAVAFYVFHMIGIVYFCVMPALTTAEWRTALIRGALFGFFVYGAYDFTNMATLKVWSLKVTIIDIAWGSTVTAVTAAASAAITMMVKR